MILPQLAGNCVPNIWSRPFEVNRMLKVAYKTDQGLVRSVNEDRVVVTSGPAGESVAIVADGMGGHQAGDTASQLTIELMLQSLERLSPEMTDGEKESLLLEAIRTANAKVYEIASSKEHYRGMGTTVTAALASDQRIIIGHIGDSRAYFINHNEYRQITEDHTLVNELLKTGQITADEAAVHPRRNVLMRALGTDAYVEVDVVTVPWNRGDVLLLCSDGLSNMVPIHTLVSIVRGEGSLEEKVERMVQNALDSGGDDNITVVLLANE